MIRIWNGWEKFWFGNKDLYSLGVFRAVFASLLFIMYSIRGFEFRLLFSNEGLMPFDRAQFFAPESYQPLLYWFPESNTLLALCYVIFLVLLLGLSLGVIGRKLCWLVLLFHLMFFQRNYMTIYGADLISNFFLLALCFTNAHQHFSLRERFFPKAKKLEASMLDTMGLRMIQVQLCITYGFTGLEKLRGSEWWEGTAVWAVLTNTQLNFMDFSFFHHVPVVVVLMTWSTLLFEVYFPVVIWFRGLRKFWLSLGFLFHMGAAVFMSLPFFSLIMVSSYLVFLDRQQIQAVLRSVGLSRRALNL